MRATRMSPSSAGIDVSPTVDLRSPPLTAAYWEEWCNMLHGSGIYRRCLYHPDYCYLFQS